MDAPRCQGQHANRRLAPAAAHRRGAPSTIRAALLPALALASIPLSAQTVDFNALQVGKPPPGWVLVKTDGSPARWEITIDPSSLQQGRTLAQLSSDPAPERFPVAVYRDAKFADGEVAVRFKPVTGSVAQSAGLVWRYRDRNNYYVVRADALAGNVVAYKVEKGRRTPLVPLGTSSERGGAAFEPPAGRWSSLRVTFADTRFTVSLDGRRIFEVEDATFDGPGQVGLWTEADGVTYFDDFEVRPAR